MSIIKHIKPVRSNFSKYFMVYLAIAFVNPTIQQYDWLTILFYFLAIGGFIYHRKKIDIFLFYILTVLILLLLLQAFKFGNFSLKSFLGIIMVWMVPYFIYRSVGINFSKYYVDIMYFLSIIGLGFWLACNLSPTIHQLLFDFVNIIGTDRTSGESFIIYNLEHHRYTDIFFMKNPGPFAEGGVFSCFLILALVLNTIQIKKLYDIKSIVFIISILTTTSTAGYISLFIFLIVYYLLNRKLQYKIILLPASIILAFWAFNNIPFLGEKVEMQFESQMEMDLDTDVRIGRFQSARVSLLILRDSPLIGKGLFRKDRFISKKEEEKGVTGTSNGIVNFALKYGLIVFFIYFYLFYKAFKYLCILNSFKTEFALMALFPILAVGSAQTPFTSPAYLIIFFHGYYLVKLFKKYHARKATINNSSGI